MSLFLSVQTLLFIVGCAGTDGSGGDTRQEDIVVTGRIESVENFRVNGITFDTEAADIFVNGDSAENASDLALGQVVTVTGVLNSSDNTGVANLINYLADVQGPIQSIDTLNRRITVLNQSFDIDDDTLVFDEIGSPIDATTLDGLEVGDTVEISALTIESDNGPLLLASRIDTLNNLELFTVVGIVSSIDINLQQFSVGDLIVDFSSVMREDQINEGDIVRVEGRFLSDNPDILIAENIFLVDSSRNLTNLSFLISGSVTEFLSPTSFHIREFNITTSSDTLFLKGKAEDIAENTPLKVFAVLNEDNVYEALSIELVEQVDLIASFDDEYAFIIAPIEAVVESGIRFNPYSLRLLGEEYPIGISFALDHLEENGFYPGDVVAVYFLGNGLNYNLVDDIGLVEESIFLIQDANAVRQNTVSGDHRIALKGVPSEINANETEIVMFGKKIYIGGAPRYVQIEETSESIDSINIDNAGSQISTTDLNRPISDFEVVYIEGRSLPNGDIVADLLMLYRVKESSL